MTKNVPAQLSTTNFLTFTAKESSIEVRYEDNTIWLTQKLMAELFGIDVRTVSEHLQNIYDSGELTVEATIRNFRIVQTEGKRQITREVRHYSLDTIISVGYRVNSIRATEFRQWATAILRDFTLRGYVLDRKRLESGEIFGKDYFEQLLEEIREIRLSERRFYQKVTDIYATATDYSPNAPTTKKFFATIQNKLHYAIHSQTAAELIYSRASASKPNMGLTNWRNSPEGKILKGDITVGKNYLTKEELQDLGRLVETFLNIAESRAKRQIPTTMLEWIEILDQVLTLDTREILKNAGNISKKVAEKHALAAYETYRKQQDLNYRSDFDNFIAESTKVIHNSETSNQRPTE